MARSRRPMISATSLFDVSTDIESLCKHMVRYLPAESCIHCSLQDADEHITVMRMIKANAFSTVTTFFHNADDCVETWDALQKPLASCNKQHKGLGSAM